MDGIEEALLKIGAKTVRREGDRENRWVLLDYLDVVVHVQHTEERQLYALGAAVARLPGDRAAPSSQPRRSASTASMHDPHALRAGPRTARPTGTPAAGSRARPTSELERGRASTRPRSRRRRWRRTARRHPDLRSAAGLATAPLIAEDLGWTSPRRPAAASLEIDVGTVPSTSRGSRPSIPDPRAAPPGSRPPPVAPVRPAPSWPSGWGPVAARHRGRTLDADQTVAVVSHGMEPRR